jgi:membrane protease YdiL (CAAX protease family)
MIRRLPAHLTRSVRPLLIDRVERDHRESDTAFRRRRIVVVITLVVGAALLGVSLAVRPGDPVFYLLTFGLAAVWVIGGFASGPLHLGRMSLRNALRRPVWPPIFLGVGAAAVFIVGSLVVAQVPSLREYTENVLAHARFGSLPLVALITALNGVAEEIFFRGALFAAIGVWHPVAISTATYGLATVTTGNPMLVFAALVLGLVVGLQRRATGGILAPILTHVTWSSIMLFALPPLFNVVG